MVPLIFHGAFLYPFDFDKVRDSLADGIAAPVNMPFLATDSIMGSR